MSKRNALSRIVNLAKAINDCPEARYFVGYELNCIKMDEEDFAEAFKGLDIDIIPTENKFLANSFPFTASYTINNVQFITYIKTDQLDDDAIEALKVMANE